MEKRKVFKEEDFHYPFTFFLSFVREHRTLDLAPWFPVSGNRLLKVHRANPSASLDKKSIRI